MKPECARLCAFLALLPGLTFQTAWASTAASVSAETTRGLVDTVGFAHTREQIVEAVRLAEEAEGESLNRSWDQGPWVAAVAPHDDHTYAGRVYVHVLPGVQAGVVVIFGVAHRAKTWGVSDRLIFDAFDSWRGPYGPIVVSAVREEILERLAPDDYVVSNEFHSEEHSIEGLLPFLQHYDRRAEIVPILVPYMGWERMDELARNLASVLAEVSARNRWIPGADLAILISADCVHYGDEGWGGADYAPFGVDGKGYDLAVAREQDLIETHLEGPVRPEKLRALLLRLVDEEDVRRYRITWCGRFSVPFGLDCLHYFAEEMGLSEPAGTLLRYGTSVDLGRLPLEAVGLGVTAPVSLHHWVGYSAIGYR